MTPTETAATLRQYNVWRRGNLEDLPQPDPREIGEAIDAAIEMIERLEAAEKSDAESIAMYRRARDERDELRAELETERMRLAACGVVALANTPDSAKQARDMRPEYWSASCGDVARMVDENIKLRAKIAAMEQQKPARLVTPTAYRWRYRGAVKWQYGELTEEVARLAKEHNHEVQALGILPGAQTQPAPSVPDADELAHFIRRIDGAHGLGASALAEKIVDWLAAAPKPEGK